MIIPCIECDHNLPVPPLAQADPVAVVGVLEQRHHHPGQGVAPPEGVGHAVLPAGVDFSDDENIIEEKDLPLVLACKHNPRYLNWLLLSALTWPVFFVGIDDLVEPAVADQPPVGQGQTGALGHDGLLDLHHLGHVVATRPELGLSDSVVNPVQHFPANIRRHVTLVTS